VPCGHTLEEKKMKSLRVAAPDTVALVDMGRPAVGAER